ncbi:uracil-DNA glycosylase [Terriglobus aquaticus]|uniref:Type-4 uracil-DNA glycosylase n=1 Tax=Terriglobus aquaticus TaxID=940139 RepID=A0ABW9KP46_9BACT|nr:uracil-DNA glycosylase [Terriglobus aquaticus]
MSTVSREPSAPLPHPDDLRAYVDYLRDLGVYDLIAQSEASSPDAAIAAWQETHLRAAPDGAASTVVRTDAASPRPPISGQGTVARPIAPARPPQPAPARPPVLSPFDQAQQRRVAPTPSAQRQSSGPAIQITPPTAAGAAPGPAAAPPLAGVPSALTPDMPAPTPFNQLAPLPSARVAPADKPVALTALREFIGDCTRCPLAYAGRHSIVFADGDPNARLMFIGEGPGADEDEQGLPFVGKAGQLLNNMISAMGLKREQVYIANIVKCRPPKNRVPEPVEANTCSQFLLQQIDIVQPEVIVALGGTAATYLLGVKQSLTSLRGQWFDVRGAKCAVTYHPAFLLRDPRQKGEAWKDLQRVMAELNLAPPART